MHNNKLTPLPGLIALEGFAHCDVSTFDERTDPQMQLNDIEGVVSLAYINFCTRLESPPESPLMIVSVGNNYVGLNSLLPDCKHPTYAHKLSPTRIQVIKSIDFRSPEDVGLTWAYLNQPDYLLFDIIGRTTGLVVVDLSTDSRLWGGTIDDLVTTHGYIDTPERGRLHMFDEDYQGLRDVIPHIASIRFNNPTCRIGLNGHFMWVKR